MERRDLALDLFKSFKTSVIRKAHTPAPTQRTGLPGDPELIGGVLNNLISEREWDSGLAEGNLFITWSTIVGADIAAHATPISIMDGVLTIQTSSSAWATQLSLVANTLLETITNDPSGVTITKLVFIGPQAPSWKKASAQFAMPAAPRHVRLSNLIGTLTYRLFVRLYPHTRLLLAISARHLPLG